MKKGTYCIFIPILLLFTKALNGHSKNGYLYPICVDKKYGYIDRKGRVVVKPDLKYAGDFKNGTGLIVFSDNSVGLVDSNGTVIFKISDPDSATDHSEYCRLQADEYGLITFAHEKAQGFIIPERSQVIPSRYYRIRSFHEGLALCCQDPDFHVDTGSGCGQVLFYGKYGYIDTSGTFKIAAKYDGGSPFYHGYAIVFNEQDTSIIDKKGRVFQINEIEDEKFHCFYYLVIKDFPGGWGETGYDGELSSDYLKGFIKYQELHRDRNGKMIFPPANYYAHKFIDDIAISWSYEKGDQLMTLYDTLATSTSFQEIKPFHDGLAAARKNDKWGFIDKTGKYKIAPTYDLEPYGFEGWIFRGGIAKVVFSNNVCYIDTSGTIIWSEKK